MDSSQPFYASVADRLIAQLEAGTAPWQKPWQPGNVAGLLPFNPISGTRYKGMNAVQLMSHGYADPRWLTQPQAQALGAQVRPGQTGTCIQFWTFGEHGAQPEVPGASRSAPTPPARPRMCLATVFNAEQITGLPPLSLNTTPDWDPIERAENILQASGAVIRNGLQDRAFYRPEADSIYLPDKAQFATPDNYYAIALHELSHWTGHPSRLGRDLSQPFGSAGYAKEELRAEIASMVLGETLGIGHDPAQHAAYVGNWITVLRNDPLEVFRAAADAEKIQAYVLGLERQQQQQVSQAPQQGTPALPAPAPARAAAQREYLEVPYGERKAARAAGAEWDPVAKSWYVGAQADAHKLARWQRADAAQPPDRPLTPQQEFAQALRAMGCVVSDGHPVMDGQKHRLPVEGEAPGDHGGNAFYVGHLLGGRSTGYILNEQTGVEMQWKSKGQALEAADKDRLQALAQAHQQARAAVREQVHAQAAARVRNELAQLQPVTQPTPYMQAKGITPQPGVFTDREGKATYVPAVDVHGQPWSMQYIAEDGSKRFAKDSRKDGCFHAVGGLDALAKAPALVISEGYATAGTLAQSLGFATVAAFDAGNLPAVAQALHARFPQKPIAIAADDDRHLELTQGINPGKVKAQEAARLTGAALLTPRFADGENSYPADLPPITPHSYREHLRTGQTLSAQQLAALERMKSRTDFNDLATQSPQGHAGLDRQVRPVVQALIEHRLSQAPQPAPEVPQRPLPVAPVRRAARGMG